MVRGRQGWANARSAAAKYLDEQKYAAELAARQAKVDTAIAGGD